ncbi:uncharacterized protein LOC142985996 [Anticarsia gemmatalis]|uniref:uncharacterized protein LOC142985996 n=1 Tax=Anticarsia gemmatalis TaxID=129554 RepID=UPI003F75CDF3
MRSAWKGDFQGSSAELVYGEPLRLPGQFLCPDDDYLTADVTQYATRLRAYMAKLSPRQTFWHGASSFYVPRDLHTTSHVFVRQDRVVSRQPKYFTLEVNNKSVTVFIDRLKPAYIAREAQVPAEQVDDDVKRTSSGRRVRFPDYYRP